MRSLICISPKNSKQELKAHQLILNQSALVFFRNRWMFRNKYILHIKRGFSFQTIRAIEFGGIISKLRNRSLRLKITLIFRDQ